MVAWVTDVQAQLKALAGQHPEQGGGAESTEDATTAKKQTAEIKDALLFYDSLKAYAEAREVPADDVPLKTLDAFVFKRDAAGKRAASSIPVADVSCPTDPESTRETAVAKGNDSMAVDSPENLDSPSAGRRRVNEPPAVRAYLAKNRFIPPWVAHLVLAQRNTTPSATIQLRQAVELLGAPPFATKDSDCLSEFNKLLKDMLEYQNYNEEMQSLPAGSSERKEKERRLRLIAIHAEVAVVSFRILQQEEAFSNLQKAEPSRMELKKSADALAASYEQLGIAALKWVQVVEKGELYLDLSQTNELTMVTKNLVNLSLLSKALVGQRYRAAVDKTFAEQNEINIRRTAGLAGVAEAHLMAASRGTLHTAGIIPKWLAHIR